MASAVAPKAVVLYANIGGVYYPVACAKDVNITTTADLLELAPRSSNVWREFEYGRLSGEISGTGITKITGSSQHSIFDFFDKQFNSQKFLVKFSTTDPEGNYKVFECNVLARELNLAGTASEYSNYTYTLQISGPISVSSSAVSTTAPDIAVYTYAASSSTSSVTISEIGPEDTILVVYIDLQSTGGTSRKVAIAPDGYGAGEVQWDPADQKLYFGTALASGDTVKIIYVDAP